MKNSGLKNEQQVQKILTSGSSTLNARTSAGLRLFKESDLSDGIIGGKLIRPKYNNDELKKSVNTEIFELLPQEAPDLPDMVLRSIYNEATQSINDLTDDIEVLNGQVSDLESTISDLEIVSESLKIEADNAILRADIADNRANIANEQIAQTTIDLQNAVQNSINESIQRVSLTARNESLLQENESLREQLFGLSARTSEGAISGADNNFTVKVNGNANDLSGKDIHSVTSHKAGNGRTMGVTLEISNVTTDKKITDVSFDIIGNPKWFKVKSGGADVIETESSETYELEYDNRVIGSGRDGIEPRRRRIGWKGSARNYTETSLEITVKFGDGSSDSVTLSSDLRKNRRS